MYYKLLLEHCFQLLPISENPDCKLVFCVKDKSEAAVEKILGLSGELIKYNFNQPNSVVALMESLKKRKLPLRFVELNGVGMSDEAEKTIIDAMGKYCVESVVDLTLNSLKKKDSQISSSFLSGFKQLEAFTMILSKEDSLETYHDTLQHGLRGIKRLEIIDPFSILVDNSFLFMDTLYATFARFKSLTYLNVDLNTVYDDSLKSALGRIQNLRSFGTLIITDFPRYKPVICNTENVRIFYVYYKGSEHKESPIVTAKFIKTSYDKVQSVHFENGKFAIHCV